MQINKEKSKKMVKLLALSLATSMMVSAGIKSKAEEADDLVKEQIEYHTRQQKIMEMINKLPSSEYNEEYNRYCNEGMITIRENEYVIKDLYIEYGYVNDEKIVYIIDYHNPKTDVMTGNTVDSNYRRSKVMLLKYSDAFYNYYTNQDKSLEEYINSFEGGINYDVPETHFYNPKLSDNEKENTK